MNPPSTSATQPLMDPPTLSLAGDLANRISRATALTQTKIQPWHRTAVWAENEHACLYCDAPLHRSGRDAGIVDLLIPKHLGGPVAVENMALCCQSCSTRKAQLDIGDRLAASPDGVARKAESIGRLTARRMAILESCPQHLAPNRPGIALDVLRKHLHERWSHPRLALFAAHREPASFIGWSDRSGPGDALGVCLAALRFRHGGVAVDHGQEGVTLIALSPLRFLDAVWDLIELHGMVTPLLTPDDDLVKTDWRHAWVHQVTGWPTLRSRRVARGLVVSGPAREPSQTRGAIALRHKRALAKAKIDWEQAEAAYQSARQDAGADPREVWKLCVEASRLSRAYRQLSEET